MYMTCVLLVRAARLSGDASYHDLAARTLRHYAARLQRRDGLFVHSPEAPHAWGRGNGFAALGLMEALTALPAEHPGRAAILAAYRAQMAALARAQGADGAWRQLVDRPESYREVTASAMTLAAMARGLRLGWLDRTYERTVSRGWDSLSGRIADGGALAGVCTGTGAGPTRRYYYDRPAIFGADDRGGAMCLLAALEVHALRHPEHP
jgi:rhamnogalacturonyl hydrolase YesR